MKIFFLYFYFALCIIFPVKICSIEEEAFENEGHPTSKMATTAAILELISIDDLTNALAKFSNPNYMATDWKAV
jgi:hypothetical protein